MLLGQLHRGDDQLSRPHRAGGVVGGVEDHRLRAAGDGSGHLLRGGQKEICRISVDKNRNAARHADHFSVADPIRRGQNHLVAGVQDGLQRVIKHLLGACAHDDLPRVIAQPLLSQDMIGNRLAQLRDAAYVGITGFTGFQRLDCGLADVLGRIKIRLACAQGQNGHAFAFHLGDGCIELEGGGGGNAPGGGGKSERHK